MTIVSQSELLARVPLLLALAAHRDGSSVSLLPSGMLRQQALREHAFACARHPQQLDTEANRKVLAKRRAEAQILLANCHPSVCSPQVALHTFGQALQCHCALERELLRMFAVEESLSAKLLEREHVVRELRATLAHERAARAQVEARDAEKETFFGILGHDLLSPLQAILTTAHLLTMRSELDPRSLVELARIASSGVRMQRLIEQLLDVTRARQASGLRVSKDTEHDLTPLVAKVVNEIRTVNPRCSIEFDEATPCRAWVDGDRFQQVASNLIGNAVVHGDRERPIAVALEGHENLISFSVHNYGLPIEVDQFPRLFEPFKQCRSGESRRHSTGLGLGLYISDCIVRAHGGRIRVTSSPERGTHFCALLPTR